MNESIIHIGSAIDVLAGLQDHSVQTCITSPPYWGLRDYGNPDQIGLEETPEEYIEKMVLVFREVRRVLKDDGTLWLNLGDSYANDGKFGGETGGKQSYLPDSDRKRCGREKRRSGLKPKDLCLMPARVAIALQADGWWVRQDIIWHKPNAMPESVRDRCTKAHEYIFLLTKSAHYYYDHEAIKEDVKSDPLAPRNRWDRDQPIEAVPPGKTLQHRASRSKIVSHKRNKRSVWEIATSSFRGVHFATFPPSLVEPCVLAGSREGDTVLDPFCGAGTTGLVAMAKSRKFIGIELNPDYAELARDRIESSAPIFDHVQIVGKSISIAPI